MALGAGRWSASASPQLGLARIVASTMAVNAASRRVMENAGLAYRWTSALCRLARSVASAEHGDVEYAITREKLGGSADWRPLQGASRHFQCWARPLELRLPSGNVLKNSPICA